MTFSKRLRELRLSNELTQTELAALFNIHFMNVSRWERGETMPPVKTVIKLAGLFGVTTDYLLGVDCAGEK